jgi:hypothetical protein
VTSTKMGQRSRNDHKKQMATGAAILLRLDHGAMAAIARRIDVHPSLVSRVARGLKTSERVRIAIVRYLLQHGGAPRSALLVEHGRR